MMVMEKLTRWRCSKCAYITFVKPRNGECPACTFGKDITYDLRPDEENEQND